MPMEFMDELSTEFSRFLIEGAQISEVKINTFDSFCFASELLLRISW